jgi:hypothetical protein
LGFLLRKKIVLTASPISINIYFYLGLLKIEVDFFSDKIKAPLTGIAKAIFLSGFSDFFHQFPDLLASFFVSH